MVAWVAYLNEGGRELLSLLNPLALLRGFDLLAGLLLLLEADLRGGEKKRS